MRSILALLLLACVTTSSAADPVNMVANGGFEGTEAEVAAAKSKFGSRVVIAGDAAGQLLWKTITPTRVSLQREKGNQFLRLVVADGAKDIATVTQDFMILDPSWKNVTLTARIRATGVKPTGKLFAGAKIILEFATEKDQLIARVGEFSGGIVADCDWTAISQIYPIPKGSEVINVRCIVLDVAGTFDFDDISIVETPARDAPAPAPERARSPGRRKK